MATKHPKPKKKPAKKQVPNPIVAYKGFDKDFKCRGFQFAVGKTYKHTGEVKPCSSGFHACLNPFDVWSYYGPAESRFAVVEQSGETKAHKDDSKIASAEITIKAELTLPEFIARAVGWIIGETKGKGADPSGYGAQIGSSGDYAQIGSSSNYAQIGSSGDYARIGSSGYGAQIGSSGDYARIGSSGYGARIGSSGNYARIGSSSNYAQIGSSGDGAQIGSSGNGAKIGSSGDGAQIGSSGKNGVIASAGVETCAKGALGTWIGLAEYRNGTCVGFATGCIGKDGLKPDTWYRARNGKLVEV